MLRCSLLTSKQLQYWKATSYSYNMNKYLRSKVERFKRFQDDIIR